MTLRIVSRAEWGARQPTSVTRTTWARRVGVAVHYSGGSPTSTPRDLQNYAMDVLDYSDTHYNFFVDRAGTAYEGRGWLVVGGHAAGQNTEWIGACFIGRDPDVTDAAKATLRALYDEGCRLAGKTLRYSGHGQLPGQNTDCPGANLRAWIAAGMPYPNNQSGTEENMFMRRRGTDVWLVENHQARILPSYEAVQFYMDELGYATVDNIPVFTGSEDAWWHVAGEPWKHLGASLGALGIAIAGVSQKVDQLTVPAPAPIDPAALAAALTQPSVLAAIAGAAADEIHRRTAQ